MRTVPTNTRDRLWRVSGTGRLIRLAGLSVLAFGVSLSVLSACSSSQPAQSGTSGNASTSIAAPSTSSGSGTAQSDVTIHISSFKYMTPATVSPGAMISVMNMDNQNHTVTADSGNAFDVKADAGAVVMFKAPTKPGSYPFHCTYHSNMHGVLIVK
jgi:plastocyanin